MIGLPAIPFPLVIGTWNLLKGQFTQVYLSNSNQDFFLSKQELCEWLFFISDLKIWGTENVQWIVLKNWMEEALSWSSSG